MSRPVIFGAPRVLLHHEASAAAFSIIYSSVRFPVGRHLSNHFVGYSQLHCTSSAERPLLYPSDISKLCRKYPYLPRTLFFMYSIRTAAQAFLPTKRRTSGVERRRVRSDNLNRSLQCTPCVPFDAYLTTIAFCILWRISSQRNVLLTTCGTSQPLP